MTEEEKNKKILEILSTEEGISALAKAMWEPARCGGMAYANDGKAFIRFGGYWYDYEKWKQQYNNNRHQIPVEWMKEYCETNEHKNNSEDFVVGENSG